MSWYPQSYDIDFLVQEVGKLLGLKLKPSMILDNGIHYEDGFLTVRLGKRVDEDQVIPIFVEARRRVAPPDPRAVAWDEGYAAAQDDHHPEAPGTANPYRGVK